MLRLVEFCRCGNKLQGRERECEECREEDRDKTDLYDWGFPSGDYFEMELSRAGEGGGA